MVNPAALLVLIATTAGCVQTSEPVQPAEVTGAGEVPFTLAGPGGAAIVVPVRLNDTGPYQFVVDTGATVTCVHQALAETLELPKPVGMLGYGAAVGRTGTVGVHRIETLEVGDTTASGLTACALDLGNIKEAGLEVDGLLGLNFLKAYKVTFDFKRNVMSLEPVR